jgi:hypothetical protein
MALPRGRSHVTLHTQEGETMHTEDVLILAMTKMLSGICTAGLTHHRGPDGRLRWLRPVREFGQVLPGDMMEESGRLIQCCDVVKFHVLKPNHDPPHVEDWIVDFIRHRPHVIRRLEGDRRSAFLAEHAIPSADPMLRRKACSLCLLKPEDVMALFSRDPYSGKYQARMRVILPGCKGELRDPDRGYPVTDLKWRALGRKWLGEAGDKLALPRDAILERMNGTDLYLTMGLSRLWKGKYWPLVHAIHLVPDYESAIDLDNL